MCGFGMPADVEDVRLPEDSLVTVGRTRPDHHRLTCPDDLACELGVAGGHPGQVPDRVGPPDGLLDSRRHRLRVAAERLEEAWVLEQGVHKVGQQAARGRGAADREVERVQDDFADGETVPAGSARREPLHQPGGGRTGLGRAQQPREVAEEFTVGLLRLFPQVPAAAAAWPGQKHQGRPGRDPVKVAGRQSEQQAGGARGYLAGDGLDEVDRAAAVADAGQQRPDVAVDRWRQLSDDAVGEEGADAAPQPPVLWRVGYLDHHPARRIQVRPQAVERHAVRGTEGGAVAVDLHGLRITDDRPEAGMALGAVPEDRMLTPQLGEQMVELGRAGRIGIGQVGSGDRVVAVAQPPRGGTGGGHRGTAAFVSTLRPPGVGARWQPEICG